MVDDRPYKAGVVGSSPTVPTISDELPSGLDARRSGLSFAVFAES
jgi:hypothetical protein